MNNPRNDHIEACPPPETLQRFARGDASPGDEAAVEKHLDVCAGCRERFDDLLGGAEPLAEPLAELRGVGDGSAEADLEAIKAAGVPKFPGTEVYEGKVVLPGGLRLSLPQNQRYLARLGDYDVVSVIGEGGMGIVLKAWHEKLERDVALKVIGPKGLGDPVARARFLKEARSAAKLKHPNIITIHAVGETESIPFIDMEYVKGKPLALMIAEEGRLKPARALRITREILAALEHAHGQGIFHRDIKPGNVLLEDPSGQVKLVDFGLACGVADAVRHTMEGTILGTPWYMSPEQASGTYRPDPRSDLFSIGVVLFEMLVGSLPFPGRDPYHVLERIRTEDAPDPCRLNPSLPRPLAEIIARALQRDPAARYASAAEFLKAIEGYLGPIEGTAPPVAVTTAFQPAGVAPQETRCSVCSDILVSRLSVAGHCEICREPICRKCWTIRSVRRCSGHAETSTDNPSTDQNLKPKQGCRETSPWKAVADRSDESKASRSPSVPRAASQKPSQAKSSLQEPATEQPLREEEPSPEERLQAKIAQARADGRTAISAAEARVAEETFVRLVENSLESITDVRDPCRGTVLHVTDWSKAVRRTNRSSSFKQESGSSGTRRLPVARGPKGAGLICDLRKRNWLGWLRGRVVIEVRNLAHLERFAQEGYDDQPVSRMELESLLNEAARHAAEHGTWQMLILYSPTGWADDARDFATGKGARPFRDRLVSVVLFEDASAQFLFDEVDERLLPFKEAFSTDFDGTTMEKARAFVDDYLEVHNSLSLEAAVSQLGISRKAGIRVFKILEAEGRCDLNVLEDVGMVLSSKE